MTETIAIPASPEELQETLDYLKRQHSNRMNEMLKDLQGTYQLPAPLALKKYIVEYSNSFLENEDRYYGKLETEEEIDAAFQEQKNLIGCDAQQDIMQGDWETNLPHDEPTRHSECDSVAIKDNYGNYIGFPWFHSGGKYFDAAGCYDYSISKAYYLTCKEKQVLTIERTWAKV